MTANLPDDGIISYAYFYKKLLFDHPFERKEVLFRGKNHQGFKAKKKEHQQQVLVHEYTDEDNFIVELLTKSKDDHILLYKSSKDWSPEQVLEKINSTKRSQETLQRDDLFEMPLISIKHKRDVQ